GLSPQYTAVVTDGAGARRVVAKRLAMGGPALCGGKKARGLPPRARALRTSRRAGGGGPFGPAGDMMRAPCGAIADTYVSGAPPMWRTTAAAIASATASAMRASRQSAKSDGTDPDRLHPSAPPSAAACLIAASPGTRGC